MSRQWNVSSGSPIKLRTNAPRQTEEGVRYRQPNRRSIVDDDNPDAWTIEKTPNSAVRYTTPAGNEVIQRGNKRFVIHDEPPPTQRRRPHWLVISGLSMLVLLLLWVGVTAVSNWWTQHQLDTTYEFPRISQADAVVYPGDTTEHPSHYLFLNLNGTVLIVELPHCDSAKARIYKSVTLFSDNADQVPITGEFRVVNGKVEMLVHIQEKTILYLNDGTQFKPQQ